jgi:transposase-like protein
LNLKRRLNDLFGKIFNDRTRTQQNIWSAYEVYVKVKGVMKYLFAMMDDKTRFLLAQEVAETKEKKDARRLFYRAKRLIAKQPTPLITDGFSRNSLDLYAQFKRYKMTLRRSG